MDSYKIRRFWNFPNFQIFWKFTKKFYFRCMFSKYFKKREKSYDILSKLKKHHADPSAPIFQSGAGSGLISRSFKPEHDLESLSCIWHQFLDVWFFFENRTLKCKHFLKGAKMAVCGEMYDFSSELLIRPVGPRTSIFFSEKVHYVF